MFVLLSYITSRMPKSPYPGFLSGNVNLHAIYDSIRSELSFKKVSTIKLKQKDAI